MSTQKNSFVTIAEQVQLLNNNAVNILTSMNKVVTSNDSSVNVNQYDSNGNLLTYSMPTVGKLQSDINVLNNNVKRLSGLNENTTNIIDGKSVKKIILSDLNREPNKIDSLNTVTQFNSTNNWFFESLMSPIISINFDLTNKVDSGVTGIISRRYIVEFEKSTSNTYTEKGLAARNEFMNIFVGQSDINLGDFENWHKNPTNTGVLNNQTLTYDEQYFDFDYQEVQEQGLFSVLSQETDTYNNKLWFNITPSTYTTINGESKRLQSGDELILNKQGSVTRWKILETETSSDFRVRLERIEGYDPVPTGANILKIYGSTVVKKVVKISIGFDEHLVIFVKPTNNMNKLKGGLWSQGTGIYTNNLVLDTDANVSMSQYYLDTVYDYGQLLKDMIKKTIPSPYGKTPNKPILNNENFKVVQTNSYLTNTIDNNKLKELHAQKSSISSSVSAVNVAIIQKQKELSNRQFPSVGEKQKAQTELNNLRARQESDTASLASLVSQINALTNSVNNAKEEYSVRGFWNIPEPIQESGYRPQEVVQFNIQYRYQSKNGSTNQTLGYNIIDGDQTKTAYFSQWVPVQSGLRKRSYNEQTEEWTWDIENVSDADVVNINQLDIPIQEGVKVEFKIQSISEVGYPNLVSDWSDILTIEFPDDLKVGTNDTIVKESQQDVIKMNFEQTLDSKGIIKHVSNSFTNNNEYIAHPDTDIQTSYKDSNGNSYNLQEYLDFLTNKIKSLEDVIYSAKGQLKVSVFDGISDIVLQNGGNININFICKDRTTSIDTISYNNNLYINKDFNIKLNNISTSPLTFLVRESYTSGNTIRTGLNNLPCLVDSNHKFIKQEDYQYIYFCDNASGSMLYSGDTINTPLTSTYINKYITHATILPGLANLYCNTGTTKYSALGEIIDGGSTNDWCSGNTLGTLICPAVNTINDLIYKENIGTNFKTLNPNSTLTIPLNVYWKFKTSNDSTISIVDLSNMSHTKKLKVRLNPSSINNNDFDFTITFNISIKQNN